MKREIPRYTADQVLAGIQAFARRTLGSKIEVDGDCPLVEYLPAVGRCYDCPLEFLTELADYFGLCWGERRWAIRLKLPRGNKPSRAAWKLWEKEVAPTITVGDLAAWISRRAEAVRFEAASFLGRPCLEAGVFLGMRRLLAERRSRPAPSTPMLASMGLGELREFWGRVEWISGVALPSLVCRCWWDPRSLANLCDALIVAVAATVAAGTMFVLSSMSLLLGMVAVVVIAITATMLRNAVLRCVFNPLPTDIQTFGQLARFVAGRVPLAG